jgi:hypothetical protein
LAADKQTQENDAMSTIASGCADLGFTQLGRRAALLTKPLRIAAIETLLTGALMLTCGLAASAREPNVPRAPQRSPGMAAVTTGLPWQAPVGHRQPRTKDLTGAADPSPADEDERLIDRAVDHRLSICRGC